MYVTSNAFVNRSLCTAAARLKGLISYRWKISNGNPRIFNNLLSSQPLCFNLFAELSLDLPLASDLVNKMTKGRFCEVLHPIKFEHSPGRRDPRYTGDRSAFDVFLECKTRTGGRGFIGVEVKYHEDMREPSEEHAQRHDEHLKRYKEIAVSMGCFNLEADQQLMAASLQQIWRDHLLAGITREVDGYEQGLFVMLYPKDNEAVARAIKDYRKCLINCDSFSAWTLEDVTKFIQTKSPSDWIDQFIDRYLGFKKIDERLNERRPV